MRKLIFILALLFAFASPQASGQTKLFLRVTGSELGILWSSSYVGYGCNNTTPISLSRRQASTTAGSGVQLFVHTPTSTAPPCHAGGDQNLFVWFSPPLSSGVTISGNIDFNISCTESDVALNAGMRMIVYRWSVKVGGIVSTIITSADTVECANTRLAIAAAAPTSTVMDVGDRLVFKVEIRNVGGAWGGNSALSVTLKLDAASGSLGDTFANFANTLSFSADSNNGRAMISERRAPRENCAENSVAQCKVPDSFVVTP